MWKWYFQLKRLKKGGSLLARIASQPKEHRSYKLFNSRCLVMSSPWTIRIERIREHVLQLPRGIRGLKWLESLSLIMLPGRRLKQKGLTATSSPLRTRGALTMSHRRKQDRLRLRLKGQTPNRDSAAELDFPICLIDFDSIIALLLVSKACPILKRF